MTDKKTTYCYVVEDDIRTTVDCKDLCVDLDIHPFLIVLFSFTCIFVIYCSTMSMIKCTFFKNRIQNKTHVSTQCETEYTPLQHILINPDNSVNIILEASSE